MIPVSGQPVRNAINILARQRVRLSYMTLYGGSGSGSSTL